jgi:hypothetical protein
MFDSFKMNQSSDSNDSNDSNRLINAAARRLTWRERGEVREKGRERERKRKLKIERFSPHVESQYIFYRALSLQTRENLSIFNFLSLSSLSLSFSPPPNCQFIST